MPTIQSSAKNLEDVRETNLALVIKLLQKIKICSRADIAKQSGLRQSTITNIVNELIHCGLVEETGNIEGCKGRRSIGITLKSHMFKVIGIRLTRNGFMVGCYDISGKEHRIRICPTPTDYSVEQILEDITGIVREFIQTTPEKLLGIGIAVPGPLLIQEERIALMTGTSGWENVHLREYFSDKCKLPVFVEHDANAGALAEWWFGLNNLELGTYIYIAAGHGIGAGIMIDGRILHGAIGIAGEIGHMSINFNGPRCQCGNKGCLESYCSVTAMTRKINDGIAQGRPTCLHANDTLKEMMVAMDKGDPLATEVFDQTIDYFGFGLAQLVNIYNPTGIIIGDEFTAMGNRLLSKVGGVIQNLVLPELYQNLSIRFTTFDRDPALIGAAALAIEKTLKKPTDILNG